MQPCLTEPGNNTGHLCCELRGCSACLELPVSQNGSSSPMPPTLSLNTWGAGLVPQNCASCGVRHMVHMSPSNFPEGSASDVLFPGRCGRDLVGSQVG